MQLLKERILTDGRVLSENILKVDSFLNHQIDVELMNEIGKEFYEIFKDKKITKILTAEVSGIAVAVMAGLYFKMPVIFAKKTESINLDKDTFEGNVYSYTKEKQYKIRVARRYINNGDQILILDDFLANGEAIKGMNEIINAAGATLAGVGVVVEKTFQPGKQMLKDMGIDVIALASVSSMKKGYVEFED
ncbi:MAG: xanthine phosphoribosyltransferase [Clostridiales bacterium]|nr:xanthine phosphoribosyltransferase [Clostridiales bacterium]